MLRFIAAASLTAVAVFGCFANAQPPKNLAGVQVRYVDLDLSDAADARTMLMRIERAAPEVCKYPLGTPMQRRCVAQAVANAVAQLNAPEVTRLYAAGR